MMIDLLMAAVLGLQQTDAACNRVDAAPPARGCTAWRPLLRLPAGEVLADHGSLVHRDGGFQLRVRIIFAEETEQGMRSGNATYFFDCARQTSRLLHNIAYTADGRRLAEGPPTGADGDPIASPPGSPNRAALDAFCPRPGNTR